MVVEPGRAGPSGPRLFPGRRDGEMERMDRRRAVRSDVAGESAEGLFGMGNQRDLARVARLCRNRIPSRELVSATGVAGRAVRRFWNQTSRHAFAAAVDQPWLLPQFSRGLELALLREHARSRSARRANADPDVCVRYRVPYRALHRFARRAYRASVLAQRAR